MCYVLTVAETILLSFWRKITFLSKVDISSKKACLSWKVFGFRWFLFGIQKQNQKQPHKIEQKNPNQQYQNKPKEPEEPSLVKIKEIKQKRTYTTLLPPNNNKQKTQLQKKKPWVRFLFLFFSARRKYSLTTSCSHYSERVNITAKQKQAVWKYSWGTIDYVGD